jgi:NAD-dependent dihydropyrimidine dehydrogenase PreA subunit
VTTYVIDPDVCINCGACEPECPNSSISEGPSGYVIDQTKCDGCATCTGSCPVEAIHEA